MKKRAILIPAVIGGAFLGGGLTLLEKACGRYRKPDYFDPAVLDREAPYKKDETLAVRDWLFRQPTEEVTIESFDGTKLWGMIVPAENAKGTVLCMHGWHGDWKSNWTCFIPFFHDRGYNVLVTHERAQNNSGGRYITYGVKERRDVVEWVRFLAERFGASHPIFLAGISMGSATVQLAAGLELPGNVRGIYADCGYTSPYDIMKSVVESATIRLGSFSFKLPAKLALGYLNIFTKAFAGFGLRDVRTADALRKTSIPVLFVHGLGDDFVPAYMSEEGYEACASEKELLLVPGAEHTKCWFTDRAGVSEALGAFLDRYTK